jgi:hypothetical protein
VLGIVIVKLLIPPDGIMTNSITHSGKGFKKGYAGLPMGDGPRVDWKGRYWTSLRLKREIYQGAGRIGHVHPRLLGLLGQPDEAE